MFYIVFISSKTNEHKYCYGVCKHGQKQQKLNFSRRNGWRCRYLVIVVVVEVIVIVVVIVVVSSCCCCRCNTISPVDVVVAQSHAHPLTSLPPLPHRRWIRSQRRMSRPHP